MHACNIIHFQWPRKEKERKTQEPVYWWFLLEDYHAFSCVADEAKNYDFLELVIGDFL
jgi:hypothetical protein